MLNLFDKFNFSPEVGILQEALQGQLRGGAAPRRPAPLNAEPSISRVAPAGTKCDFVQNGEQCSNTVHLRPVFLSRLAARGHTTTPTKCSGCQAKMKEYLANSLRRNVAVVQVPVVSSLSAAAAQPVPPARVPESVRAQQRVAEAQHVEAQRKLRAQAALDLRAVTNSRRAAENRARDLAKNVSNFNAAKAKREREACEMRAVEEACLANAQEEEKAAYDDDEYEEDEDDGEGEEDEEEEEGEAGEGEEENDDYEDGEGVEQDVVDEEEDGEDDVYDDAEDEDDEDDDEALVRFLAPRQLGNVWKPDVTIPGPLRASDIMKFKHEFMRSRGLGFSESGWRWEALSAKSSTLAGMARDRFHA